MACNLYSFQRLGISAYTYNILDCSGNTQTLYYPTSSETAEVSFCANEILGFTGVTPSVTSGACQSNCTCFTTNFLTYKSNINYVDCNNNYLISGGGVKFQYSQPGQFFDFCALFVSADTQSWSTVNNGDCTTGCTFCRCITVHNVALDNYSFNYTDCNGVTGTTNLVSGQTITFCGLDTNIVVGSETSKIAINYGNQCVADPGGDYPFKCPCKCTTVSDSQEAVNFNVNLIYVDCNGNTNTILPTYSGGRPTVSSICMQNSVSVIPGVRAQPNGWSAVYGSDCVDNSCPCYCYSINTRSQPFSLEYQECGSISATTHNIPIGVTTFCSASIITQQEVGQRGILYIGGACSSGSCVCNCYSLSNTTEVTIKPYYIDCNNTEQQADILAGETQKICSLGFRDVVITGLTITNEGPCINGYCPVSGDCTCYYVISTNGLETIDVSIVDCDNIPTVLTLAEGDSFCAKSYISSNGRGSLIGRSDGLCTGGLCPQNVSCYNIDAGEGLDVQTYYIDPDGVVSLLLEPGPVNICAIAILTEYNELGNPTGFEVGTVTNTGDCVLANGGYNCPVPCYCFYTFDSTFVEYTNCNYESVTLSLNPGFNKICAQSVAGSDGTFYDSGLLCDNNRCPNYCCNCYTILSETDVDIIYLNCDLQLSQVSIIGGEPTQICALNIPNSVRYTIILNGPCYNGQCVDTMSIQDQLLYDILTTYGPCPDICCGENEGFGGPVGIDINDIKSGKVL